MGKRQGSVQSPKESLKGRSPVRVVVATSILLSFISFWRAAAIVLNDLGSSAFYVGGIAEKAIGPSAPWFILGVMLFSYAVRAVYIESCGMFTRGGVYRVVKAAMGPTLGKLSVSALIFDYILTAPISGVSAGQYLVGWLAQTLTYLGYPWQPDKTTLNRLSAGIALGILLYFWRRNTRGVHESSEDALRIMKITTVMVVILVVWGFLTLLLNPSSHLIPPLPWPQNLQFDPNALGWLPALFPSLFAPKALSSTEPIQSLVFQWSDSVSHFLPAFGILIGLGHSFLAMSGEESLAQVNRELEYPKHKNLMRAGLVIFLYSLFFTSFVSFFASAIIPAEARPQYSDNLISGIAMYLVGPIPLKLIFQGFIVGVGFLMLAGAVNTAIIGSNGVLNRVSEDGVLAEWFRTPHRRFGTSHRIINGIVLFQVLTVLASQGNVYLLGEAYAFGVIWSFAFKGLAMLILRFKVKTPRPWKVPLNFHWRQTEIPVGLGIITLILFSVAGINLFTKKIATLSGLAFTGGFFLLFTISEKITLAQRRGRALVGLDPFQTSGNATLSPESLQVRPGNLICLVRDYNTLEHLKKTLEITDTSQRDVIVTTIRLLKGPDAGYEGLSEKDLFTHYEQILFSRVISLAERAGKKVHLLIVPATEVFQAIALTATQLSSTEIVAGQSSIMKAETQSALLGDAWEKIPDKLGETVKFKVIDPQGRIYEFSLGAHLPQLTDEDIDLIHQIWLDLAHLPGNEDLHHRDVVSLALQNLATGLIGPDRKKVLRRIFQESSSRAHAPGLLHPPTTPPPREIHQRPPEGPNH